MADGIFSFSSESLQLMISSTVQPAGLAEINSCGSKTAIKLHVVMVPYPIQGQINPMMQFAKLLTTKHEDIMVTLVNNKHNHDCIQRTRASTNNSSKLHLTWVDNGLPADYNYSDVTGSRAAEFHQSAARMKEPLKQLLQSLKHKSSPAPVSCLLFGTFCPWAQSAAAELSIPNFLFWTQSASMFSIYYHMPLLVANGFFPYNKNIHLPGRIEGLVETTDLVTYVPGLPPLHPSSFPSLLQVGDFSDPSLASVKEQFSLLANCSGVIINSFEELEKDTCQALQRELPYSVSLVGPLLPSAFLGGNDATDKTTGASLLQEKSDCIKWLDGRQKQSVLYISFGSLFNPSAAELESIATGIKSCKQPYLWVMRPNSISFKDVSADILPKGFVEETKDYGLIITWAPQIQVLSHPSVGAFLTHCGWNSTLESLSMGIPMISFPILVDQPTNSSFVCDIWKVGMALKRQDDGKVTSEDVETVVRKVFQEEEGLQMRERASKLRGAARQTVQAQGLSYAHLEKFVRALRNIQGRRTSCN